jgi:hypothetical protein
MSQVQVEPTCPDWILARYVPDLLPPYYALLE